MTQNELSQANDKELPASLIALRRAARVARQIALRMGTAIIVRRGNKTVRIAAQELRGSASIRIRRTDKAGSCTSNMKTAWPCGMPWASAPFARNLRLPVDCEGCHDLCGIAKAQELFRLREV